MMPKMGPRPLIIILTAVFFTSLVLLLRTAHPRTWTVSVSTDVCVPLSDVIKGPLNQSDIRLERLLLAKYLQPPVSRSLPYVLENYDSDPSMGQSGVVKKLFNYKRNGFFIECGALDGETRSNTLSLEKDFGWKGLLIEGDPSNFRLLKNKNRKAWLADCCLAVHPYPHEVNYLQEFNTGKIVDPATTHRKKTVRSQCFPLYSILSAINVSTIDYFSLDVEGYELDVLRTIPFDRVYIKVLSVEFLHGKEGQEALRKFMEGKGYKKVVVTTVKNKSYLANDLIFVHERFSIPLKFPEILRLQQTAFLCV